MIFRDQGRFRGPGAINGFWRHDKLHDGLTHITRNFFGSGSYDGNNKGTLIDSLFSSTCKEGVKNSLGE
jgi:hypothetical protein